MAIQQDDSSLNALAERIHDIRFAMMTTLDNQGELWSRPMATRDIDEDGTLWFFTKRDSGKVENIKSDHRVNLSYAKPEDAIYVSITGTITLVDNPAKKRELWNAFVKAWFPDGVDDPDLILLKVTPEYAEYWEGPKSSFGRTISVLTKLATGGKVKTGKNVEVDLKA